MPHRSSQISEISKLKLPTTEKRRTVGAIGGGSSNACYPALLAAVRAVIDLTRALTNRTTSLTPLSAVKTVTAVTGLQSKRSPMADSSRCFNSGCNGFFQKSTNRPIANVARVNRRSATKHKNANKLFHSVSPKNVSSKLNGQVSPLFDQKFDHGASESVRPTPCVSLSLNRPNRIHHHRHQAKEACLQTARDS